MQLTIRQQRTEQQRFQQVRQDVALLNRKYHALNSFPGLVSLRLKTPEGNINAACVLMKRNVKNADTVRERLETIQTTTAHRDALIDRLLEFASTEYRVPQYQPLEVRDVVVTATTNAAG